MKKTSLWLIVATVFVVVGCVMFTGALMATDWDFTRLSSVTYETNEYTIDTPFTDIVLVTDTAHVVFVPTEDTDTRVVCYEETTARHAVTVKDGALTIALNNTKKWYDSIGIGFGSSKLTVYIPRGTYGVLSVKSSTGAIDMEGVSADTVSLSVSTGKVKLTDVTCNTLLSDGSTGDVSLKNVVVTGKISVERSTGDVTFEQCDASRIFVRTDTGNVAGTFLTGKQFVTDTDTGDVNVPQGQTGGKCEIHTDTGNITIK